MHENQIIHTQRYYHIPSPLRAGDKNLMMMMMMVVLIQKESTFHTHFLSFLSLLYVIYTRLPWLLYYPQVTIFTQILFDYLLLILQDGHVHPNIPVKMEDTVVM